jgi:hypothetical protein
MTGKLRTWGAEVKVWKSWEMEQGVENRRRKLGAIESEVVEARGGRGQRTEEDRGAK